MPLLQIEQIYAIIAQMFEDVSRVMHFQRVKSILSRYNGMNLYRGCQHGCIYCDSRSLCYQMHHDFEDIAVKENALQLLEASLKSKRSTCMIGTGSMSDPYIPLEKKLKLTRGALECIEKYGFCVSLLTKSDLVLRDLDLLQSIHNKGKAVVQMTLTTADENLCRIIEPGVCTTGRRAEVLYAMRDARIPTIVWLDPILPFINDTEENIMGILNICAEARVKGIICFGMGLPLRDGNREYFYKQLDKHFPGLKQQYIAHYGMNYEVLSPNNEKLMGIFHRFCEENNMMHDNDRIFYYISHFDMTEREEQLTMF